MGTVETRETPPLRWHQSLIVRILVLCAVLVLCLFGAVYFLTVHYYQQVVTTMQGRAQAIAESVKIQLDALPEIDFEIEDMPERLEASGGPIPIELQPIEGGTTPSTLRPEIGDQGNMYFMATQTFELHDGRWVELTVRLDFDPQTEIIRAFKNRFLLSLTLLFLMTLGAMIYVIAKALRPLSDLSESCTNISGGDLSPIPEKARTREVRTLEETFNRMVASLREKETVEANLRRAQRLSAIGNLAAGVAHDVRNPLNAIKLLSSQALDELAEDGKNGTTAPARALATIRSEVNRLEDIVSRFLSLAKEDELRREWRRLDPVLEECLNLVQRDAEFRGIHLSFELRAGDVELPIDVQQIKRAVLNILINALEACPAGGRVRLFSRTNDASCEIEVRDDGPGLNPEALEHAFDPYFTTKATGTGLGLSITRGIIEGHGGTIALSSSPDRGTQVLVCLARSEDGSCAESGADEQEQEPA